MMGGDKGKKRTNECSVINDRSANKRYLRSMPASHVEPQMLAAASRLYSDLGRKIVAELQGFILRALKRSSIDSALVEGFLSDGLLAALPVVLGSGLLQVSVQGAEIVGAAALWSYEVNAKFASDKQVVKALVGMISEQGEELTMAACNAAMDLATTSIGRKSLIEAGAMEQFWWEGFMHIALHCWAQNQKRENFLTGNSSQKMLNNVVGLLHVAIRSIGDSCNLFRKACTIAALPFECFYRRNKDWKGESGSSIYGETCSHEHLQKGLASEKMFASLIETLSRRCSFTDAYRIVQVAISNSDGDSLRWMRWLRHLSYGDVNPNNELGWSDPLGLFREMFQPDQPNVLQYEKSFLKVKTNFCIEVKFEEACKGFEFLLNKYRYARKQFSNGMLALHSVSMKEI